jgi:hypothetical protein
MTPATTDLGSVATQPPRGWARRFAVYAAVLFASWNFNLLALPSDMVIGNEKPRARYLGSESDLVLHRVALPPGTHPLHPMLYQAQPPCGVMVIYRSQFGIQAVALAALKNATGLGNKTFVTLAPAAFALLAAMTLAGVFATAHRWLGPPVGDVACALGAATSVLVVFAPSLYWAPFLMLLPFATAWCLYPSATTPLRKAALFAAVGAAVCLKALAGYEYITAVILAPVAAAWFHQHRAGASLGRRFAAAAGLVAVGVAGFAAALALHVTQIRVVFHEDGVAAIRERATQRTAGALGLEGLRDRRPGESATSYATRCFLMYFDKRAVSIPAVLRHPREDVSLRWVAVGVLALAALAWAGRRLPRDDGALAGAALIGLAAGASWQFVAINHMCVHRHMGVIMYAVSFLPVAYVLAGYAAKLAAERAGADRWAGPALLTAVAGLMAFNAVDAVRDRRADRLDQAKADALVAARLAVGGAFAHPSATGSWDVTQRVTEFSDYYLADAGLLGTGASVGEASDPGGLIIHGWAVGDWGETPLPDGWAFDRATARVVIVCGGEVVKCKVTRFSRSDVDVFVRKWEPLSGFRVVVPSTGLRPGAPVRLFLVSEADPDRITELPPPR